MRRLSLVVLSLLVASACATRERHLRSHPAVFAEPHDDFVVLVPFNRVTPAATPAGGAPVQVASLSPSTAGAPATEKKESLTRLLHEFREAQESAGEGKGSAETASLLDRIATGYSADVAAVRFRCVDIEQGQRTLRRADPDNPARDRCTYIAADLRDLMAIPSAAVQPAERNDVISMLLNASDHNCSNFLVRAFAKKTNMDSRRNTLKDIGTGLSAIMANPAPAIATGLGLTNLVTSSAVDNYNASFYLEKTFQVMESAIGRERAVVRNRIVEGMKKTRPGEYTLYAALNDVRSYDDACSIERGLAVLSELAAVEKNDAEKALNTAVNPEAETTRELTGLLTRLDAAIQQLATTKDQQLFESLRQQRTELERTLREFTVPAAPAAPDPAQPPQQQQRQ